MRQAGATDVFRDARACAASAGKEPSAAVLRAGGGGGGGKVGLLLQGKNGQQQFSEQDEVVGEGRWDLYLFFSFEMF